MASRLLTTFAAFVAATALLAGCAASDPDPATSNAASEPVAIRIAAVTSPMTDIVTAAGTAIDPAYEIELVEVADYVTVNKILAAGDVEANFAQHTPFMEEFNAKNDASLQAIQPVYNFVIAFYSREYDSIEALPDGARVAIPDDSSNTARALKLLADDGVITLDPAIDPYAATLDDVTANPRNLQFQQLAISQLNTAYAEADLVFQWPSHISALGLTPQDDGLLTELDDRFALNVVVPEGTDAATITALQEAFSSDAVRDIIAGNPAIEAAF